MCILTLDPPLGPQCVCESPSETARIDQSKQDLQPTFHDCSTRSKWATAREAQVCIEKDFLEREMLVQSGCAEVKAKCPGGWEGAARSMNHIGREARQRLVGISRDND